MKLAVAFVSLLGAAQAFNVARSRNAFGYRSVRQATRSKVKMEFGVVITGGAAGVGFAYADEFLARGHSVVICDVKDCELPVKALQLRHPEGKVYGKKCDVSSYDDCEALGEFSKEKLG